MGHSIGSGRMASVARLLMPESILQSVTGGRLLDKYYLLNALKFYSLSWSDPLIYIPNKDYLNRLITIIEEIQSVCTYIIYHVVLGVLRGGILKGSWLPSNLKVCSQVFSKMKASEEGSRFIKFSSQNFHSESGMKRKTSGGSH